MIAHPSARYNLPPGHLRVRGAGRRVHPPPEQCPPRPDRGRNPPLPPTPTVAPQAASPGRRPAWRCVGGRPRARWCGGDGHRRWSSGLRPAVALFLKNTAHGRPYPYRHRRVPRQPGQSTGHAPGAARAPSARRWPAAPTAPHRPTVRRLPPRKHARTPPRGSHGGPAQGPPRPPGPSGRRARRSRGGVAESRGTLRIGRTRPGRRADPSVLAIALRPSWPSSACAGGRPPWQ